MKSLKVLVVLSLLTVLCLPGVALADFTFSSIGWYDNYQPPSNGPTLASAPIDTIQAYISTGPYTFADPGIQAYGGGFYQLGRTKAQ